MSALNSASASSDLSAHSIFCGSSMMTIGRFAADDVDRPAGLEVVQDVIDAAAGPCRSR